MELWIRSQDKEKLIQIKNTIYLLGNKIRYSCELEDESSWLLGTYETKERALEVLYEIQNILKPPTILKSFNGVVESIDNNLHIVNPTYDAKIEQINTYVYEMPKD